jgi:hypothetical protein
MGRVCVGGGGEHRVGGGQGWPVVTGCHVG